MARGLNSSGKSTVARTVSHAIPDWVTADSREALAERVAEAVVARLQTAIDIDGKASLVVSGGSTPAPVFAALSNAELDWQAVTVTLADERWVPGDHDDSNEKLVRSKLLVGKAAAAQFVSLYRDGQTPEESLREIDKAVGEMPQPFSVVLLGMGADGHTASLFPDADGVKQALAADNLAKVAVMKPASQPQVRITLTRAALLNASQRMLHITGLDKRMVLEGVLSNTVADSEGNSLPIGHFFEPDTGSITVYWSE